MKAVTTKKLLVLLAMPFLASLFSGCIGLAVEHPREKTACQICLGTRGSLTNGPSTTPLTEAEVLAHWGRPDTIFANREGLSIWRYRGGRNWSFVMPAYLIVVPIPVASNHDHTDLYFRNGIVQKAPQRFR